METVEVKRHSLFYRIVHWSIVFVTFMLVFTGIQLGGLYNIKIVGDLLRSLHGGLGLIFICLWYLFFYYIIVKEWKWFSLARIPYSLKFLIAEAKAWFGIGEHVEDPRGYDPDKKEYVEKIIPTEVGVWWIYLALAVVMGATGLAMMFPNAFGWVYGIAKAFSFIFGTDSGYAIVRAVHRLGMYAFLFIIILHVYAVFIFGVVTSMITGKRNEKVVKAK